MDLTQLLPTSASSTTPIDLAFSLDTTGSMSSFLATIKQNIVKLSSKLFLDLPCLKMAFVAHGDYCDRIPIQSLDFTSDPSLFTDFIKKAKDTNGGDTPECYELALKHLSELSWRETSAKVVIVIGDAYPHTRRESKKKLFWREELQKLLNKRVKLHGAFCQIGYPDPQGKLFFQELAAVSEGVFIEVEKLSELLSVMSAAAYREGGMLEKVEAPAHFEGVEEMTLEQIQEYNAVRENFMDEDKYSAGKISANIDQILSANPTRASSFDWWIDDATKSSSKSSPKTKSSPTKIPGRTKAVSKRTPKRAEKKSLSISSKGDFGLSKKERRELVYVQPDGSRHSARIRKTLGGKSKSGSVLPNTTFGTVWSSV